MATEEKAEPSSERDENYLNIAQQLEDIQAILKQTYDAFLIFQEPDRELVSEEGLLLEEGLAKERREQELEHDTMRAVFREKIKKEQELAQTRIVRKVRSMVADRTKNSQVWDSS